MSTKITENGWTLHYLSGHPVCLGDQIKLPGRDRDIRVTVLAGSVPPREAGDTGKVQVSDSVTAAGLGARPDAVGCVWMRDADFRLGPAVIEAARASLNAELAASSKAWSAVPGVGTGPSGLTPDAVKFGPEYRAAAIRYRAAADALRRFNKMHRPAKNRVSGLDAG